MTARPLSGEHGSEQSEHGSERNGERGSEYRGERTSERGRVLVAKVGLDGHDRGVKVVGRILRDAGFEVIYTGLQQTPAMVVAAARDEDVDVIGLSLLSGAHMTLVPRILDGLREQGVDIPVVVGGIIPVADAAALRLLGVAAVLTPGASSHEIIGAVTRAIDEHAHLE